MKRYIFLLLPILIISGCQNRQSFTINGVIQGSKNNYIYLKQVNVNALVFLDSAKINKNGKFHFRRKTSEPDFYQVGFSANDFITILAEPGEKLKLNFIGDNLYKNYSVSGSKGSEQVRMLDLRLNNAKTKLDSLRIVYDEASKKADFNEKGPLIEAEFTRLAKDLRKRNIEFIINNTKSMASIKAIYQRIDNDTYVLYDPRDLQYLKIVTDSLMRYYPNSKNVKALAADTKKELDKFYANKIEDMATKSPPKKLDPNLKDISGNRIALSSLRGKVVLLTFWSTESQDCISENLQLKEIYKKYEKSGFEIYQINLDEKEETWINEVRFDELPWINTREDDPAKPENAILFNVRNLPANFLFDKEGTIVATNLHGKSLLIKLNQLFNF